MTDNLNNTLIASIYSSQYIWKSLYRSLHDLLFSYIKLLPVDELRANNICHINHKSKDNLKNEERLDFLNVIKEAWLKKGEKG